MVIRCSSVHVVFYNKNKFTWFHHHYSMILVCWRLRVVHRQRPNRMSWLMTDDGCLFGVFTFCDCRREGRCVQPYSQTYTHHCHSHIHNTHAWNTHFHLKYKVCNGPTDNVLRVCSVFNNSRYAFRFKWI